MLQSKLLRLLELLCRTRDCYSVKKRMRYKIRECQAWDRAEAKWRNPIDLARLTPASCRIKRAAYHDHITQVPYWMKNLSDSEIRFWPKPSCSRRSELPDSSKTPWKSTCRNRRTHTLSFSGSGHSHFRFEKKQDIRMQKQNRQNGSLGMRNLDLAMRGWTPRNPLDVFRAI